MAHAIILVGFMGAGKSTVGRVLAQRLGWNFTDLDDLIRGREGREIPDIFRDSGQPYFRRVEHECLRDFLRDAPSRLVLALGGGAIVQPDNAEVVRESGIPVIFLDAPVDELLLRCREQAGSRPLLVDENQFRQLYESRAESYMEAGMRIETASLSPEQVADEIVRRLDLQAHN